METLGPAARVDQHHEPRDLPALAQVIALDAQHLVDQTMHIGIGKVHGHQGDAGADDQAEDGKSQRDACAQAEPGDQCHGHN